ncbi:hypothetical protein JKP88DRAFT_301559 [Tribonema minus]|uniref:Uncharacterized protein n=1 Tax=Tribonema minus TaxID=303371 RepID=A0A835ZDV5_9STRA|nr:hypothetical protein JKP88DRAFT_301559 [Tribonema minus]
MVLRLRRGRQAGSFAQVALMASILMIIAGFGAYTVRSARPALDPHAELADTAAWYADYMARSSSSSLIVYNRVGKCGSTTLLRIMSKLHERRQLLMLRSLSRNFWGLHGDEMLERWVHQLLVAEAKGRAQNTTLVINGHAAWVNLTEHGGQQPIYINMLRDPISRIKSTFYYLHSPDRHPGRSKGRDPMAGPHALAKLMGNKHFARSKHTLTKCLRVRECRDYVVQTYVLRPVHQFYGMTPDSGKHPTDYPVKPATIQRAVRIMEHEYLLVIPLDELDAGLLLLECLLPQEFKGALQIYQTGDESTSRANSNNSTTLPADEDVAALRKLVEGSGEARLYSAAQQRFCRMWRLGQSRCPRLCATAVRLCDSASRAAAVAAATGCAAPYAVASQ